MMAREEPDTVIPAEGTVGTADGLELFWRAWLPRSPAAGAIVLVHGLAEHSGRYGHVGRHFASRGWATYALDTRAHGRSPGPKVDVGSFDEFVEDVRSMLALARSKHPDRPVFLMGHSQGGLVVLLYAMRHPEGLPGVAVTSPFLGSHPSVRPSRVLRLVIAVLRRVAPRLLVPSGVDPGRVSRDPRVVEAYRNDPLVSRRVSAGWYAALRRAQAEVRAGAARLPVPALVLASPDDRLVDPEAIRRFVAAAEAEAPPGRVESSWWPGLSHELLNEPEQERVLERLDAWLDARARTP